MNAIRTKSQRIIYRNQGHFGCNISTQHVISTSTKRTGIPPQQHKSFANSVSASTLNRTKTVSSLHSQFSNYSGRTLIPTHKRLSVVQRSMSSEPGKGRGPVSWTMLGIVGVAAAAAVAYYRVERERRLEKALGTIVSSESGWSPGPAWANRIFKKTNYGWFPVEEAFSLSGKPAIGGPWSLVDLEGNLVTEQSFAGKWTLLYFGFARCPDICPSEMVKVAKIIDMLKEKHPDLAKDVVPIFVSVDPARDSLRALKEYSQDFHPDYVFLTGAPEQVQQMAKKYRVYVSKADETEDGDYLVDHSIVIYFHDDKGELADVFTQSMKPTDVMEKVVRSMTFVPSF